MRCLRAGLRRYLLVPGFGIVGRQPRVDRLGALRPTDRRRPFPRSLPRRRRLFDRLFGLVIRSLLPRCWASLLLFLFVGVDFLIDGRMGEAIYPPLRSTASVVKFPQYQVYAPGI